MILVGPLVPAPHPNPSGWSSAPVELEAISVGIAKMELPRTPRRIANLGDVNYVDFGGFFVFVDENGTYGAEAEYLEPPTTD